MSSIKPEILAIEQGRCYLVDMNPPRRSKPGKVRPVVVIQATDTINGGTPGVVVVPLTTRTHEENILRIPLTPSPALKVSKTSDVLLDQVHTIDRKLFLKDLGEVPPHIFAKIRAGVRFLLDF